MGVQLLAYEVFEALWSTNCSTRNAIRHEPPRINSNPLSRSDLLCILIASFVPASGHNLRG